MSGKDGHGVEPLSCKEQARLGHLHTAVVAVLASVEEHPEIHGSGEEVSDVRLCHWIRDAIEHLIGVLDVRDGFRSELSGAPDPRAQDHEAPLSRTRGGNISCEEVYPCMHNQFGYIG